VVRRQNVAGRFADAAHRACPYSNPTQGNIDVILTLTLVD
jgi:organic hydroperoxide reductase OsmC/OhrA